MFHLWVLLLSVYIIKFNYDKFTPGNIGNFGARPKISIELLGFPTYPYNVGLPPASPIGSRCV